MRVKVSSNGQLAIPEAIRKALGLDPGPQVDVQLVGHKIVIEPVGHISLVDDLYGKFPESDFLADMEVEHREELADERAIRS